ncbi:MAG: hypothetical protein M3N54_05425 [Acidobacteriota bacterium]|nr:hypothetical protein [Acidobacteriota bacterium]
MIIRLLTARLAAISLLGIPAAERSVAQTYSLLLNADSVSSTFTAPLTSGTDGNFYGTASQGRSYGTIFRITRSGALSTLHAFNNTDGATPVGGVIFGTDGLLYGSTTSGGANGAGTVYKISTTGTFTSLYSFSATSDGASPAGKLVQGSDSNFYGVTFQGGANGCGSIFQITPAGTYTVLHQMVCHTDGGNPRDGLILANDGYFYGTASAGGSHSSGTVFKVAADGTFTVMHNFATSEGYAPYATVMQASDGLFYGTTFQGGSAGNGTVFTMAADGAVSTLHTFIGNEGRNPAAPLIEGADGNFYGTAYHGGDAIYGTVFAMNRNGVVTRLHSFTGSDGQYPQAPVTENPAGTFYGTTYQGGFNNKGVIYSVVYTAPPPPPPSISAGGVVPVYSTSPIVQSGEWVSVFGSNLAAKTISWKGDFPVALGGTSVTVGGKAAFLWYVSPGQINMQVPDGLTIGVTSVVVTTSGGNTTASVTIAQASPSFCLLDGRHVAAIILRSDGSGNYGGGAYDIAGPTGTSFGYSTIAARAGDSVVLFGVGFGPTDPAVSAGQAFSGAAPALDSVFVQIGGVSISPSFAGLSSAGLYQLNLVIPSGLGVGDLSLQASVGGALTQTGPVISLQ